MKLGFDQSNPDEVNSVLPAYRAPRKFLLERRKIYQVHRLLQALPSEARGGNSVYVNMDGVFSMDPQEWFWKSWGGGGGGRGQA